MALIGPNGPDWVLAALAVIYAGRVLVPLDAQFTPSEVLELIGHSEATALIASRRYDHDGELKNFPGLTGTLANDGKGECAAASPLFMVVENGEWVEAPGQ